MSKLRIGLACLIGISLHLCFFYGFLSYTQRNLHPPSRMMFMFLAGVAGFAVNIGLEKGTFRIASCILAGVFVSHIVMVIVDCWNDATNHNLLPFEFVLIAFCASPVYVGAALAAAFGSRESTSFKL